MWTLVRRVGAVLILGILVARLGTGPFLDGVRGLGPGTLLVALTIGGGATLCSARRRRVGRAAPARGRRGARREPLDAGRDGGLLPLAVPQHRAARRGPRGCGPRGPARS